MRFIVFLIAGLAGGILGGMGMGGGTVLIPILTIFCGVEQRLAQSANLIAFLPMAILSLKIHSEHGLLDTKGIGYIIIPALVLSVACGFLVNFIKESSLQTGFGIFLCLLSVWQFVSGVKGIAAKKTTRKKSKKI